MPNSRESQADDQRAIVAAAEKKRVTAQRVRHGGPAEPPACDFLVAAVSTARLVDLAAPVGVAAARQSSAPSAEAASERRVVALGLAEAAAVATATLRHDSSEESLTDTLALPVEGVVFYQSERPAGWAAQAAPKAKRAQPRRAAGRHVPCKECDGCHTRFCRKCKACLKAKDTKAYRWQCEKRKCLSPRWLAFANAVTGVQAGAASGSLQWGAAARGWTAALAVLAALAALALLWVAPRVLSSATRCWRTICVRLPQGGCWKGCPKRLLVEII